MASASASTSTVVNAHRGPDTKKTFAHRGPDTKKTIVNAHRANSCYEIFLSHRGPDTKKTFASHLYRRLVLHGFRVFWDKEEMQVGDTITSQIQDAIKTASVHVAIFSPRYAESNWCLDELHLMVESGKPIIPVFYGVQPTEVRQTRSKGVYAEALHNLENKRAYDSQPRYSSTTIEKWRTALSAVGGISGLDLENFNGDEGELLDEVVDSVSRNLRATRLDVAEHPTGLDEKIEDFENNVLLVQRQQSDKAHVIGIVGMGGVGKTTLVKDFFNRKRSHYKRCCFLSDVRENARKASLESLQKKLLRGLSRRDEKIESVSEGIELLKTRLSSFQALVILDDVDNVNQLDALLRPIRDVLHSKSLILITSRDRDVLTRSRVEESSIYRLTVLNPQHSQELFCLHAFAQRHPFPGFEDLVDNYLEACNQLPLSLKVFGALLYGNHDKSYWEDQLERLQQILPDDIQKSLQISYDALQMDEKQIFLDIACFFIGEERNMALRIWDGCGWEGSLGFRSLQNKSLVEVDIENKIRMHDHLRDLGRDLAKDQTLPRRIWRTEDFEDLLLQSSVVTEVRGICMRWTKNEVPSFSGCKMRNLQLLDIDGGGDLTESILRLVHSTNLIWFRRRNCGGHSSLPSWISMMKLRVLEMEGWNSKKWWQKESQPPLQLRGLRINSSATLRFLPDFFGKLANLQHLSLSHLGSLEMLPDSIGNLTNLQHINLSHSPALKWLPDSFGNLKNLQHINLSYSSLNRLPDSFGNLTKLKYLNLTGCLNLSMSTQTLRTILRDVTEFHHGDSFGNLTKLKYLNLTGCLYLSMSTQTLRNILRDVTEFHHGGVYYDSSDPPLELANLGPFGPGHGQDSEAVGWEPFGTGHGQDSEAGGLGHGSERFERLGPGQWWCCSIL